MPEYTVRMQVKIYNQGGLHPLIQNMKAQMLQAAEADGQLTPDQVAAAKEQLIKESRPVREQCSFEKTITLPYAPVPAILIDDEGFIVRPTTVTWVPHEELFEIRMDEMVSESCTPSNCNCLKHLMAEENGWKMYMADVED